MGETPYLTNLTRVFNDNLVIANATGCSSIYGGSTLVFHIVYLGPVHYLKIILNMVMVF